MYIIYIIFNAEAMDGLSNYLLLVGCFDMASEVMSWCDETKRLGEVMTWGHVMMGGWSEAVKW